MVGGMAGSGGEESTGGTHRVAWELSSGYTPDGLCVLHHCDNPLCVNPGHLFLGTQKDNMRDMEDKGRGNQEPSHVAQRAKTHCPSGHPYNEENTRHYKRHRHCRMCDRERYHRAKNLRPTQQCGID